MRVPASPLQGKLTSVRPATDADTDLLVGWHRDPEIARYWDNETFTHEEMRARLARPDADHTEAWLFMTTVLVASE